MNQNGNFRKTGNIGEIIAANYLKQRGYKILEMNFENKVGYRLGEIDIVARDIKSKEIIFVEIKTRRKTNNRPLQPETAITRSKYRKLSRIISNYLNKHNLADSDYRLDAISIELDIKKRRAALRHLLNIYF